MVNRISIAQRIGRGTAKFREQPQYLVVDIDDSLLVVPLASPRDLDSWDDERTREMPCPRETTFQSEIQRFISAVLPRSTGMRPTAVFTRFVDYVLRSIKLPVPAKSMPYSSVGLTSSSSSWSHPASSRPGLIRLLSSVTTACAFNHENPAGRQSTSAKLDRQEPYENGLGGGAPGINVLCAWFLICASESVVKFITWRSIPKPVQLW